MNTVSKKIFVVKFNIGYDDDSTICKAFAGHLSASQYVNSAIKSLLKDDFKPENGEWRDPWTYVYNKRSSQDSNDILRVEDDYVYKIEEVDVEQDVILPELPAIEKENLALKSENDELREKLACIEGAVAEARRHLVMWDGGWEYDKKQILKNVHKAKELLESLSIEVIKVNK